VSETAGRYALEIEQWNEYSSSVLTNSCNNPGRLARWRDWGGRKLRTLRRTFDEYIRLAGRTTLWDSLIAKDVPRTLAGIKIPFGNKKEAGEEAIRLMLRAWVARSEEEGFGCGYVQSMNFVCAVPCLLLDETPETFALCCNILEEGTLPELYASWPPLAGLVAAQSLMTEEIERRLPRLAEALGDDLSGLVGLLLPKWLLTCFAGVLPATALFAVWEEILSSTTTTDSGLRAGTPGKGADTPRTGRKWQAKFVTLRWAMGLLVHFESRILERLAQVDGETPRDVNAFQFVSDSVASLSATFRLPDMGLWDTQRLRRRHTELLQELRDEVEQQRLRHSTALDRESLTRVRTQFEMLRVSPMERRRNVEVDFTPLDSADLGLIFADSDSPVILAINSGPRTADGSQRLPVPPLTGWQVRALDCAVLASDVDFTEPWGEWKVLRWEWERTRQPGFFPFSATETQALEESWSLGRSSMTKRGGDRKARERTMYTYDFVRMEEIAHDTGHRRKIRRVPGRACEQWRAGKSLRLRLEATGEIYAHETQVWSRFRGWKPQGAATYTTQTQEPLSLEDAPPPAGCHWDGPWQLDRAHASGPEGWVFSSKAHDRFSDKNGEQCMFRKRWYSRSFVSSYEPVPLEEEEEREDTTEDGVDLETLGPVIHRALPEYDIVDLPNLFRLLDVRCTGRVGFLALTVGLSMLAGGTVDYHLRLLHNIYDSDADGLLSHDEAERLVLALSTVAQARRQISDKGAALQMQSGFDMEGSVRTSNGSSPGYDSNSPTGSTSASRCHQQPLQAGQEVLVTQQDEELLNVTWVVTRNPEDEEGEAGQGWMEVKQGWVKEKDTCRVYDDDGMDPMQFTTKVLERLLPNAAESLGLDKWVEFGQSERLLWRGIQEAGIFLGNPGDASEADTLARRSSVVSGLVLSPSMHVLTPRTMTMMSPTEVTLPKFPLGAALSTGIARRHSFAVGQKQASPNGESARKSPGMMTRWFSSGPAPVLPGSETPGEVGSPLSNSKGPASPPALQRRQTLPAHQLTGRRREAR